MPTIHIQSLPGFDEWRDAARTCLKNDIPPTQIDWRDTRNEATLSLFQADLPSLREPSLETDSNKVLMVPKAFMDLVKHAICHSDSTRFSLLYRVLWRLNHENKNLLHYETDADILELQKLVKGVRRDAYKIKAYLRFREVTVEDEAHFVSWYEPEHYTLELSLPFFQERFKNMRWSILTPYRSAHWNGESLALTDEIDVSLYPTEDTVEAYWLRYYASTFNPARLKIKAMLTQMPKKYWKNMPETVLIEQMIRGSSERVETMINDSRST